MVLVVVGVIVRTSTYASWDIKVLKQINDNIPCLIIICFTESLCIPSIEDGQMLTICVVSKSMDMKTMLPGCKAFDFSCDFYKI